MSTVKIQHISKSFGGNVVLQEINETFHDGEFITLLGPSGCGKSTMLRMIAGFERPTSGELYINDRLVSGGKTFVPPEKRNIGMVFQSYAVWPHMNVFDNIAYPLSIKKISKAEIRKSVEQVMDITHLTQYAERFPNQLSGGQQQRIALARALVSAPDLLLLDEPLSNLDAKLRESMRFEIKELQKKTGITVVYVTHDQTEAMAMSDRIFLLHRGIVQQVGTPNDIYNRPANQFVADFLGKVDFFKGESANGRIVFPGMDGQSVRYDGSRSGKVDVAVRPENIYFSADGPLEGVLETQYYLGDVDDCRVRIGETLVRVIANGYEYQNLKEGQQVHLSIRDMMVFEDDGTLEQMLEIRT
ncbi:MAG: ABC transporter ATP-binding protein [Verrucomicrobia bacterium]|nr:ABC transporter ATP-binding protein [Verrucomicrobiota bacterium]